MKRVGYQVLGFVVWQHGKWYLRRQLGNAPRNIALAGLLVAVVAALLLAGRKASPE